MDIEKVHQILKDWPDSTSLNQNLQRAHSLILLSFTGDQIGVTDDDLANDSLESRKLLISELEKQKRELSNVFTKILSTIDIAIDVMK